MPINQRLLNIWCHCRDMTSYECMYINAQKLIDHLTVATLHSNFYSLLLHGTLLPLKSLQSIFFFLLLVLQLFAANFIRILFSFRICVNKIDVIDGCYNFPTSFSFFQKKKFFLFYFCWFRNIFS